MLLLYSQTVSAIATATCDLRAAALLLFEAITKLPQKRSKLLQNHKTVPNLANEGDFPTFWHELIILRGGNKGQICPWQPVKNSAPIRRRLVEKPLKTVLFHQNDYHWLKNRRVAWLYFRCDHFEGHMSHILRTAKKKVHGNCHQHTCQS